MLMTTILWCFLVLSEFEELLEFGPVFHQKAKVGLMNISRFLGFHAHSRTSGHGIAGPAAPHRPIAAPRCRDGGAGWGWMDTMTLE